MIWELPWSKPLSVLLTRLFGAAEGLVAGAIGTIPWEAQAEEPATLPAV